MSVIGDPIPDQWYLREDTGETFLVTDYDEQSGTIEIQTADGDLDELDEEAWQSLPLILAEPSRDWMAPIDSETGEDGAGAETELQEREPSADSRELWEDPSALEEIDPYTERLVPRELDS